MTNNNHSLLTWESLVVSDETSSICKKKVTHIWFNLMCYIQQLDEFKYTLQYLKMSINKEASLFVTGWEYGCSIVQDILGFGQEPATLNKYSAVIYKHNFLCKHSCTEWYVQYKIQCCMKHRAAMKNA